MTRCPTLTFCSGNSGGAGSRAKGQRDYERGSDGTGPPRLAARTRHRCRHGSAFSFGRAGRFSFRPATRNWVQVENKLRVNRQNLQDPSLQISAAARDPAPPAPHHHHHRHQGPAMSRTPHPGMTWATELPPRGRRRWWRKWSISQMSQGEAAEGGHREVAASNRLREGGGQ